MPAATGKTQSQEPHGLSREEISQRLIDIEIAQTSAIRDLEMDIRSLPGRDASVVIQASRKALHG